MDTLTATRGNAVGKVNHTGKAWIVQTESPRSAHLHELRDFLPRSKKAGETAAAAFGGRWRYIPGYRTRGGWAVDADSPEELAAILTKTGIPVTVYLYSGTFVPDAIAKIACAVYAHNRRTGYFDLRV